LVAQQTAANLHVSPGDQVSIATADGGSTVVTIAGVVDLPQANSLFQTVGAPSSAQPTAPPDNVLLLPASDFSAAFSRLQPARPDLVITQIHVRLDHRLPSDPAVAYVAVTGAANNLSAALAGAGAVGDNLAASLDAARSDASYARLLFVFLGLPGSILAALLTVAIADAGASDRRRDQALLRLRGADVGRIAGFAVAEAAVIGVVGGIAGLLLAGVISAMAFGSAATGDALPSVALWAAGAFLVGVLIAMIAIAGPAVRDARALTIAGARRRTTVDAPPWWSRLWLDLILIAAGVGVFIVTTQTGYTLVLAPEGVATINVNYVAFLGPALVWIGAGLLSWRLVRLLLGRRAILTRLVRPVTGRLASTAAASFGRQRNMLARSAVLLGLTLAFATSTAVFNSTYQQQAEVDARLTNGADVRVEAAPGAAAGPAVASAISDVPGVSHVEAMQHRYAYVGSDLQDLYGVNASTISSATSLQDAYFQGGSAAQLTAKLAATPDGILVSAETVQDYQLALGDQLTLRLVSSTAPEPVSVSFHYIGIALEFPTAPKDSFLIANADYVASKTGNDSVGTFLIATDGTSPATVADRVQSALGTAAAVTPIGVARSSIGSSLTSVDLRGLTQLELGFALALGAASGGLVLVLRLRERRTTFAVAGLMGASRKQLRGLVLAEGSLVAISGIIIGGCTGAALSGMLVAVLTGVFDPPPASLAVPWPYLLGVAGVTAVAVLAAALAVARRSDRPAVEILREA
jgi:putative ABC transport system permease protein